MARARAGAENEPRPTVKDRVGSTVDAVQDSQAWSSIFRPGSIFRKGYTDSPRNRSYVIMNSVLYHLHPVKVKRHAVKVSYTLCLVRPPVRNTSTAHRFGRTIADTDVSLVSPGAASRSSVLNNEPKRPTKGEAMDWWILELITVMVMFALIGVLGPLIKRYGKSYAADVFRVNPRTGKSYLVLMDFAYYLIFGAYILFTIKWEPDTGWEQQVNAEQLQGSVVRIGGLLLLMGLLHGLNVLTLPVIGRIFTLNRQLDDDVAGPRAA